MEKITQGCSRETNIARGEAKCYIRLKTKPECYFFPYCTRGSALTDLLYWLVYSNKLQRLGAAIERQST